METKWTKLLEGKCWYKEINLVELSSSTNNWLWTFHHGEFMTIILTLFYFNSVAFSFRLKYIYYTLIYLFASMKYVPQLGVLEILDKCTLGGGVNTPSEKKWKNNIKTQLDFKRNCVFVAFLFLSLKKVHPHLNHF